MAVVQDASDAIMITDDDGTIRYASPATGAIFGAVPAPGGLLWDLAAPAQRDEVARAFANLRDGARGGSHFVAQAITRRDETVVHVQARCSDLRADPRVAGLVFTLRDVTAQVTLEQELTHLAFHDELTHLPNRVLFADRAGQAVAAARRGARTAALLFVDLDDFKLVNDSRGHGAGDELLIAAANRLSSLIRDSDTAARLGGDEFGLLLADAGSPEAVEAAADRVIAAFRAPFPLAAGPVTTTATVGVATTADSSSADELLRHADLALYAAKAAGKRCWRHYEPVLSDGILRQRELQEALEEAVATGAFTLAYQPIIELASGRLAGFEALIRWPRPGGGVMMPGQFIGLAEETGLIIPLGAWVLRRAAADLAQWRPRPDAAGPGDDGLYVSVNVSARQFDAGSFPDTVQEALRATGLPAGALMIELTETALLRRDDSLHADLAALKESGVRLAVDDFGTGYSSLSYLGELPIDVLKIDQSFIGDIATSERRRALVEGIVRMARDLSLAVVTEGIETEAQRALLVEIGCDYGQGFLLARPMPADQAAELARAAVLQAAGH